MKKKLLNEKFSALAAIGLGLVSAACGGGGGGGGSSGDGSNTSQALNSATSIGVFTDAPVDGLVYKTYTVSSGVYIENNASTVKKTKNGGQFEYNKVLDNKIRFFVDNLSLGDATPDSYVTPMDLSPDPTTPLSDVQDPDSTDRSIKILRLLQTLDADKVPSNGISLTAGALNKTGTVDKLDISTLTSPVTEEAAVSHFMTELKKIDSSGKPKQSQLIRLVKRLNDDPTRTKIKIDSKTDTELWSELWPQSRIDALDAAIKAKLKSMTVNGAKHSTLPGVVMKVKLPNGTVTTYTDGYSDLGTSTSQIQSDETAMTTAKHFRLGSITKTFTGMTAMELVSEYGFNTLTSNITTVTLGTVLGANPATTNTTTRTLGAYDAATFKAAVDSTVPNKLNDTKLALLKEVTIYQLLTHLSGLKQTSSQQMEDKLGYYDYKNVWALQGYHNSELSRAAMRNTAYTTQELLDISYDLGLEEPGKGWHYSNANYVLLGKVIEKLSGRSWDAEVKRRFGSGTALNLTSLDYTAALPTTLPGNTNGATGYIDWYSNFAGACTSVDVSGNFTGQCEKDTKYSVKIHPSFYGAAGGLTGTIDDLYSWATYLGQKYEDPTHPIGMLKDTYFKVIANVLQMGPAVFKNLDRKLVGHPGQVQGYDCYVGYRYNVKDPIAACTNTTINDGGKIQAALLNAVMDMIDGKTAL
ncbi:MAG: beta-lactamase family protein [Magnetococcus sp. YQC-9]